MLEGKKLLHMVYCTVEYSCGELLSRFATDDVKCTVKRSVEYKTYEYFIIQLIQTTWKRRVINTFAASYL